MAKRKARRGAKRAKPAKSAAARRAAKRPAKRPVRSTRRATPARAKAPRKQAVRKPAARQQAIRKSAGRKPTRRTSPPPSKVAAAVRKAPRLDRARRTIDEVVQTPPSSLDMDRHGSAARTGRAELAERRLEHAGMSEAITAGDVDVDLENAYFSGDETPGGDNPTPDQDIVDDIGKALGVEYQDNEELRASDKVIERDRHRWELDPASSEDYKSRK
jgi:hypothetical protein